MPLQNKDATLQAEPGGSAHAPAALPLLGLQPEIRTAQEPQALAERVIRQGHSVSTTPHALLPRSQGCDRVELEGLSSYPPSVTHLPAHLLLLLALEPGRKRLLVLAELLRRGPSLPGLVLAALSHRRGGLRRLF